MGPQQAPNACWSARLLQLARPICVTRALYSLTHMHTHTHMHAHTHIRTHTRTHTYTHTHKPMHPS